MSKSNFKLIKNMRNMFVVPSNLPKWYPGHMFKGIKDIQKLCKNIDVIIEIHDARIPFTGRKTMFQNEIRSSKPYILLLNKNDLFDIQYKNEICNKIKKTENIEVFFTNLNKSKDLNNVIPKALELVQNSERFKRSENLEINMLILGIPNVGKSTFMNQILTKYSPGRYACAKKGDLPGITKTLQTKVKVSTNPLIYLYDTPGILEPFFENKRIDPLKLAACNILPIDKIGEEIVADFILFYLNFYNQLDYVDKLCLGEPSDNITEVLCKIAVLKNYFISSKRLGHSSLSQMKPNLNYSAVHFIKLFQNGHLGKSFLDKDKLLK